MLIEFPLGWTENVFRTTLVNSKISLLIYLFCHHDVVRLNPLFTHLEQNFDLNKYFNMNTNLLCFDITLNKTRFLYY